MVTFLQKNYLLEIYTKILRGEMIYPRFASKPYGVGKAAERMNREGPAVVSWPSGRDDGVDHPVPPWKHFKFSTIKS